ncbi:hyaluronoglucosaminidase [Streptomyces sp. NPDC001985]|uniref:hyaluronoglucosaminidase n=1 Tax=Streptomyces sp. NPDC001985 TaxID=3154406 RepID=UPI003331729F
MTVNRRNLMGGLTAGALTVVASGAAAPAASAAPGNAANGANGANGAGNAPAATPGTVRAETFVTDSTVNSASFKTTSTTAHTATIHQAGKSGGGVALNIISDNPDNSAVYLTGHERNGRGTLKISHMGYADGGDADVAAVSIDLRTAGTAAQGIYVTATNGPTSGNLICLRNNGRDDFVVKGSGRVGIGMGVGNNPWSQLHIIQQAGVGSALMVEGVVRVVDVATAPTAVDSRGGGALYAQDGVLWWRSSDGKPPTRIAPPAPPTTPAPTATPSPTGPTPAAPPV